MDELSAQFVQKVIAPYDPYAAYYSPQGYKQLLEEDRGRYSGVGIGLTFDKDTGSVKIAKVYLNSPAYKNGVKESDILVAGIKKDETEYTYFNTAVLEFNQDKPENERITALKLTIALPPPDGGPRPFIFWVAVSLPVVKRPLGATS